MKKRIVSIIISISILVSSSTAVFAAPLDIPFEERPLTVDSDAVSAAIQNLEKDLKKKNNYDNVFEDYKTLIDFSAQVEDVSRLNRAELEKLDYGMDCAYTREKLNENYDGAMEQDKNIDLAIKSILDSIYADKFREYWGEERTSLVENITGEIDTAYKDFNDRYYELLLSGADGVEFAKLLKEVIAYNINEEDDETVDDEQSDYTTDMVWDYCNKVGDYYYYVNKFKNYGTHNGLSDIKGDSAVSNPLETLSFVGKIDPKLDEAYKYLVKNNLCFYNESDEYFAGTTYYLDYYDDAEVLVTGDNVIGTLIHEFGHFQTEFNTDTDNEEAYFGENSYSPLAEFESQMFELLATDYYDEIYGENADAMKFEKLVSNLQTIGRAAQMTAYELSLYSQETLNASDEELNEYLTNVFGDEWYEYCQFYFTLPGGMFQYSLTMFDAAQVYDTYLHDKDAGVEKYFEACSYRGGTYDELTKKLGLVSAFDEDAYEYLCDITNDIFKTEYNMDYQTALDYFENGTYLGNVYPTSQKVSVNGGKAQTLFAYSSGGYNYIRIRDLARLLSGTDKQFDVEYDEETYTVNIIPNKPYTSDGTEMLDVTEPVETAGQKAAGTYSLLYNGERMGYGGAMFINGWNCYLLRGLAEYGNLGITVDYDKENDTVLIYTE